MVRRGLELLLLCPAKQRIFVWNFDLNPHLNPRASSTGKV
jgi:hypothetical protein